MKTLILSLAVLIFINIASANAQERAAAGAIETQMTWTTLSNMVKAADDKATAVNTRVDQVVVCGKKGKIYAPEATGADAQGCLEASSINGTTLTTMLNTINALSGTVTTLNNTMASVLSCGSSGRTFNGSTCITAGSTVPAGTMCGASSHSTESGRPLVYSCNGVDPKHGCPAGYTTASAPIWGGKNGQSVSWCFKQ